MEQIKRRIERTPATALLGALCLIAALSACAFTSGCGSRRADTNASKGEVELANAESGRNSSDKAAHDRPEPRPKLTVDALLRDLLSTYSNAKYYSDEGYVEIGCELEPDRRARSYRVPCSVAIAKPNFLRVRLGNGLLRSDGQTLRAEISESAYSDERLETAAPLLVSSIREFYPDPQFAESAALGIPTNLFWTSPQLTLLYARDAKKTLVPTGAKVKLLDPEYLERPDESPQRIPCDRLQISADDGARVLWISRTTKTLARCELPIEQTVAPNDEARVVTLTVEFPRQKISDSAPDELDEFQLGASDKRLVERFYPPELAPLGRVFPKSALEPWSPNVDASDADVAANVSGAPYDLQSALEPGRRALLFFWRASDFNSKNFNAFQAFTQASQYSFPEDKIRFVGVNCDDENELDESDELAFARSIVSGMRVPSARLARARLVVDEGEFPAPDAPSFLLLDERGVVQKYVRSSFSFLRLQRLLTLALNGRDLAADDANAYYAGVRRFSEFVETTDERDVYRTTTDFSEPIAALDRSFPKTFRLREAWRFEDLKSPSNPTPVYKTKHKFTIDLSDGSESAPQVKRARSDDAVPEEALVVPCDGAALAILTRSGKLVRKTTPSAALGEPITFARTIELEDGKRLYAASGKNQSRKLHRFDENFNDLGTLDVGGARGQWVGDVRFADLDGDGTPEMLASLLGDPSGFSPQTNGVYAIDLESRKPIWKYESILAPYQAGIFTDVMQDGETRARLFAIDYEEGVVGTLVELDPRSGEKLGVLRAPDEGSIRAFGVSDRIMPGYPRLVALVTYPGSGRAAFVGFDSNGTQIWRNPAPGYPESAMDRVTTVDLDGDGFDEWVLASPDGAIQFFGADGRPLDVFQYGEEISGVCTARWGDETFLIVSDLNKVTAWRLERRSTRSRRAAQPK